MRAFNIMRFGLASPPTRGEGAVTIYCPATCGPIQNVVLEQTPDREQYLPIRCIPQVFALSKRNFEAYALASRNIPATS